MIISHKLQCIFVAVPKTATHAIRFGLREHMDADDVEQVGLFVEKRAPYPGIRDKRHGHITAPELRSALGDEMWNDYFSFAFVRNPWDRFVSNFFFLNRSKPEVVDNPFRFMRVFLDDAQQRDRLLMLPQTSFLHDAAGTCLVDFVGRYERLQKDYEQICARLSISPRTLDSLNTSARGDYRQYYDDNLIEAVAERYAADIAAFDYQFDDGSSGAP